MDNLYMELRNASFSYDNKKIFNDISFSVNQGEVFCVLGPNGCGKTTLLDCILGISKLNDGDILFNNISISSIGPKKLAELLAYVPQSHQRTFPYTVEEIVLMGRAHKTKLFSAPTEYDKQIVTKALKRVGIESLAKRPYTQISGGQCQLVMIARALAQESKIIIMDEPTSHLDFKHELILLELVVDLIKEREITVIMATHFPNHPYYFENKGIDTTIALMNNGSFEEVGSPKQILNESNIKKVYNINSKVITCDIDENSSIRQVISLSIDK